MRSRIFQAAAGCLAGSALSCAPQGGAGEPLVQRVVLVHGFLDDDTAFQTMCRRLERHGIECYAPRLSPADGRGGLDRLARNLKADIDSRFGPDEPIAVVGFSMGGIVGRHYLQNHGGADRCVFFATISSPHNGTRTAWLYPSMGATEMRPGSPFLENLQKTESALGEIPVVSYRTPLDLMILPPTSSIWERAENVEFPVWAHPFMLISESVIADLEGRLLQKPSNLPP